MLCMSSLDLGGRIVVFSLLLAWSKTIYDTLTSFASMVDLYGPMLVIGHISACLYIYIYIYGVMLMMMYANNVIMFA